MFVQFVRSNLELVITGLLGLQVLLLLLLGWSLTRTARISAKFKVLLNGTGNDNLEDRLIQALEQSQENKTTLARLLDQQVELKTILARCLQNRAVHRFNAFDNLGGEQSFTV
ncbi:MAG TPA: DUF4446 family protein, partial [Bacillota bacterium]|nr:DUF4446 family protein [Bacillota bacterium]